MKKFITLLVLVISFFGLTMPVYAESMTEDLDITVVAEFEETDYQGHAQKPQVINFEFGYFKDQELKKEVFELSSENNYTQPFVNVPYDGHIIGYLFKIIDDKNSEAFRYYDFHTDEFIMDTSGKLVFDFKKARTSVSLNFSVGNEENYYILHCLGDSLESNRMNNYNINQNQDLSGAKFQLLDNEGNVVHESVTDAEGNAVFDDVIYGKYFVKQISAPQGLEVNQELLPIDIKKENNAVECSGDIKWFNEEIVDEPIVDTPKDSERPEVDEPIIDVPEKPTVDKPVLGEPEELEVKGMESSKKSEELSLNDSKIIETRDGLGLNVPNTGISATYAPYVLVILLGLLSMVSRFYFKMRKINKD